jgi:hypothetical protein
MWTETKDGDVSVWKDSRTFVVPFDDHRFQSIFIKLYNRLFTQEEFKYLPPKFSYALKDLASDLGIFERADVSSVISSGSTSLSMTTTSGFNMNFNEPPNSVTAMMLRNERDLAAQSFPLSTIKERIQGSPPHQQPVYPSYGGGSNYGPRSTGSAAKP